MKSHCILFSLLFILSTSVFSDQAEIVNASSQIETCLSDLNHCPLDSQAVEKIATLSSDELKVIEGMHNFYVVNHDIAPKMISLLRTILSLSPKVYILGVDSFLLIATHKEHEAIKYWRDLETLESHKYEKQVWDMVLNLYKSKFHIIKKLVQNGLIDPFFMHAPFEKDVMIGT